ncbi:MAG TPA: amino acid adenylation domain-containing protein [Thermoanaerobaculia bacterium]|jgi:amino acid adenylation domain-containing protein
MAFESIDRIFCRAVDRHRSATAIDTAQARVSYADLDDRSSNVANFLLSRGIKAGDRIGVCCTDPVDAITAVIGCLKSGTVFVPLDARLPRRRLESMILTAQPSGFLAAVDLVEALDGCLPEGFPQVALGVLAQSGRSLRVMETGRYSHRADDYWEPQRRLRDADPDQICYIYFTSGSTGEPKGISGRLKAIDHYVGWEVDTLGIESGVRVSQLTNFAFDAFLRDVFVPLAVGGTVCVPPGRGTSLTAQALVDWIDAERLEVVHAVPSLFRTILDPALEPRGFDALRFVLLAGEHLLPSDVEKWTSLRGDRVQLVNLYGPSETTMTKFFYFVKPADKNRRTVPIGKPMHGARAVVVDEVDRPCSPGQLGEILIRTPYCSLGYFGKPELTAAVFTRNPFSRDPNDVVYRTGDLGRIEPDGNFELMGRKDQQVKIRGVRVEVTEVENRLLDHEQIREVAVVARGDRTGTLYLCAYFAARRAVAIAELRAFLAEDLPEPMVPSVYVQLDELPKTANGKIDRLALPDPSSLESSGATPSGGEPRTVVEQLLAQIWAEVLQVDMVGIHDSFFDLGGHSLTALRMLGRVTQILGTQIPMNQIFETETIAGMADAIEKLRCNEGPAVARFEPLPRLSPQERIPLSFAQERLLFLDRLTPGSSLYNLPLGLRLQGELDPAALERSLNEITARHSILRTAFLLENGEPVQAARAAASSPLAIVDLCTIQPAIREQVVARLFTSMARLPFDLAQGSLWRRSLVRLSLDEHVLMMTIHHIVCDAWSFDVLTRELRELYQAYRDRRAPQLAELSAQYADFAVWQRARMRGELLAQRLEFWRRRLGNSFPVLDLPIDRPRPPVTTVRGTRRFFGVPGDLTDALRRLGRREGATLFMIFLGAFELLLARYSGQERLCIGIPVSGRIRPETENLIGMFVNTLVVPGVLARSMTFVELLAQVREAMLGAHEHQDLPFEKLVEELQPRRDLGHSPLFQVMFVFQNAAPEPRELPGMTLRMMAVSNGTSRFDLTLAIGEERAGLHGYIEYKTDLFDATTARRLWGHLARLLEGIVERPGAEIESLSLIGEAQRQQLLREWNDTAIPRASGLLHELVEERAERSPEAVALTFEGRWLSYRALDSKASRLARDLSVLGAGPEEVVGVCAERSIEMVVALLGTLKSGAAYLPLEPGYPEQRLAFMLEDAGVKVLLAGVPVPENLRIPALRLDALRPETEPLQPPAPRAGADPDSPAYVIYTSGSTGKPKAVVNTHRAICNRLRWMQDAHRISADEKILHKTAFSFDVSVWELFLPLITGARLVVARPEGHKDGSYLAGLISRNDVTTLHFVPSMFRVFLEQPELERCRSVRRVIASGESLTPDVVGRFRQRLAAELHNLYGPTEAAVEVTSWACPPALSRVSIGRPIANTRILILGAELRPVPINVAGELCIGGMGLARGYLARPALSAGKFVPDPAAIEPGGRLYMTGDRARFGTNGAIEYLGRLDFQVKLRGFRIELGEIEAALEEQPGVRQAVAVVRETAPGDQRLVAYVVSNDGRPAADAALLADLRKRLPEHMVPATFVHLDALPLTSSGKVARNALPEPDGARPELATAYRAPGNRVERAVARIWREELGLDQVGIHDSFFDLGGHSLLLLRVHGKLRDQIDDRVTLIELFQYPTIASLAAHLDRASPDPRAEERRRKHLAGLRAGRERLSRRRARQPTGTRR